ncbi:MAG: hypothetical protein SFU27_13540 [Thermonemataceae bacterium]|nr:hypothetical protein [Thermonemataceae bacterium]
MKKKSWLFWKSRWLSIWAIAAFFLILAMIISKHWGESWVYQWDLQARHQIHNFTIQNFEDGILPFAMQIPVFFVQYEYIAKELALPTQAAWVWWGVIGLSSAVLLAAITYFKRAYFLVFSTLLIIFIITLRLDLLGIFGSNSKWLVSGSLMLIFLGLAYYFHTFGKEITFGKKIIANLFVFILLTVIIAVFSSEKFPLIFLTGYAMPIPFLLAITLIFLVSSEIPYHFASFSNTQGITGKMSFKQFHLVMIFYVANLVILYLKNTKILADLDFFYIDDFYLLAISIILGFWGTRYTPLFQSIVPSQLRSAVYLALVIAGIGSIAYLQAVANEAAIAALEDFIVYAHIGFAFVIWAYTYFNLRQETFQKNVKGFAEIFYGSQDKKIIPFYMARGMGFLVMGALIFKEGSMPFKQSIAAYYIGLGDVYFANYNKLNHIIADDYYAESLANDLPNHRAWYARASLIRQKSSPRPEELALRIEMLQNAKSRDPKIQDYALIAQEFASGGQNIFANIEFKEGITKFPNSPELANNLALLYAEARLMDSAYFYFSKAQQHSKHKNQMETNFLSLLLRKPTIPADSLENIFKKEGDVSYETNRMAILASYNQTNQQPFQLNFVRESLKDTSRLNGYQLGYLYNYLASKPQKDTMAIHISKMLTNTRSNDSYLDWFKLAETIYYFKNGNHKEGIRQAEYLSSLASARYEYLFGQYLMYLGQAPQAIEPFNHLSSTVNLQSMANILYHKGAVLASAGNREEAIKIWQRIAKDSTEKNSQKLALQMLNGLSANPEKLEELKNDTARFVALYYQNLAIKTQVELAKMLQNPDLKIKAYAKVMQNIIAENGVEEAENFFNTLPKNIEASLASEAELNVSYLWLLYSQNDLAGIENILEKLYLSPRYEYQRSFFRALTTENKEPKKAEQLYNKALAANPSDIRIYPKIINFFNNTAKQPEKAYDIALQITYLQENDPVAWKIYAIQAIKMGYTSFVEDALTKLRELSLEDYEEVRTIFSPQKTLDE